MLAVPGAWPPPASVARRRFHPGRIPRPPPHWLLRSTDPPGDVKLLGKWECTDGPEHIKGGTVEFLKDGKGKATHKDKDGKEVTESFTYAIDGDAVKVTHKGEDGKDVTSAYKVKTLTDKEMVAENAKGEVAKFKKK